MRITEQPSPRAARIDPRRGLVRRMKWAGPCLGAIACLVTLSARATAAEPQAPAAPAAAPDTAAHGALVKQYCVTCHSKRLKTGGFVLEGLDLQDVAAGAEVWERVIRKLRTGAMPPLGAPKPAAEARQALAAYLEQSIDRAAAARPNPGRTEALHRLNRMEYQNAIRDLLALDIDAGALIPADDQSYGFDNIAGVLKMSPTRLDRYVNAAREISSLAVGTSKVAPMAETFRLRSDLSQYQRMDDLPLGTRGGMMVRYTFPRDGEYTFKLELIDFMVQHGTFDEVKDPEQLELAIDGERIKVWVLQAQGCTYAGCTDQDAEFGRWQVRVPVKAGPHDVSATFIKKTSAYSEAWQRPFTRPHGELDYLMYQPHLGAMTISGPFNGTPASDTPSRKRLFVCTPTQASAEAPCAKRILSTVARRAYRRPVTDADVQKLMTFYEEGRSGGAGFDAGIENAVAAILVNTDFLYRIEQDPAGVAPGGLYQLSDVALASRLSFFLWSSIPDDELLDLAARGTLRAPGVLERQVERMLKDPRASALATNFAGQWLRLRNLADSLPNTFKFPNFSDNLRRGFVRETELLFDSIVKENRSATELLTADFTHVNEPLAKFYGIQGVYGNDFRRVSLTDKNRRGLLGHASVLLVNSYPDRTSPVGRGKWILENVLGTPPPPPPADVPTLNENGDGVVSKALSMRERMVAHRANPVCASCHRVMDPLGLALENFDAVGRWRDIDENGSAVDASGAMPDGTPFNGPAELRERLVANPEQFVGVVAEKLLVYALGRGVEYYDAPALREIVRRAAADDYRFAAVVAAIARSLPFTMRAVPSDTALSASRR